MTKKKGERGARLANCVRMSSLCFFAAAPTQIYTENLSDLLVADGGARLQLRENVRDGVYVEGLSEVQVQTGARQAGGQGAAAAVCGWPAGGWAGRWACGRQRMGHRLPSLALHRSAYTRA